jgi:hypothetical protein
MHDQEKWHFIRGNGPKAGFKKYQVCVVVGKEIRQASTDKTLVMVSSKFYWLSETKIKLYVKWGVGGCESVEDLPWKD